MKTKILLAFITLLITTACATHKEFVINMNNWVGSDIKTFNKHMGKPSQTTQDCNQDKTYVYNFEKEGSENNKLKCDIWVEVDKCIIKKISWEGSNCKAYSSPLK